MVTAQVDRYDIEFPSLGEARQIKMDASGYLWFHDTKDYYWYNGHQIYSCDIASSLQLKKYEYELSANIVFHNGFIVFINGNKLSLFHPIDKTLQDIWLPPEEFEIDYIYEDDEKELWIFTSNKTKEVRKVYLANEDLQVDYLLNLPPFNEDTGIFWDFEVSDKDGDLYIFDRLGGLLIIDKNGEEKKLKLQDQEDFDLKYPCSLFRLDNLNQLWRIWENNFEIYDESQEAFIPHPMSGHIILQNFCNTDSGLPLLNLRSIYVDKKDNIWLLNAASYLVLYELSTDQFINFRKTLVDQLAGGDFDVLKIEEDNNGNIWGLKIGGVFKIKEKTNYFKGYAINTKDEDHPLYQNEPNPTLLKTLSFYNDFAIKNTEVHSIVEDSLQNIYFQDGTLTFKIHADTKELEVLPFFMPRLKVHFHIGDKLGIISIWDKYYSFDKNYKLTSHDYPINHIQKTFQQKNGQSWISGLLDQHSFMFGKLEDQTLEFHGNYEDPSGEFDFSSIHVKDIVENDLGEILLGTSIGILRLDPKRNKISRLDDGFELGERTLIFDEAVDQIYFNGENEIWIKTKYEICLLNLKSKVITNHLPIDESYSGKDIQFVPSGDTAVWVGNQLGIAFHNFKSKTNIQVSETEGIDVNKQVTILKKLSDGRIAAGTHNGLYIFHPDSLLSRHLKQVEVDKDIPLLLSAYSYVDGKTDSLIMKHGQIKEDEEIKLGHKDRRLNMEFSLMNYKSPRIQQYQHWLEGHEKNWSAPSVNNFISYSYLPSGDYTLHVKGTSGGGIWSDKVLRIPIIVVPAWYTTWWAIILMIAGVSSIVFLYIRSRYKQILKFQQLRSDISKDLHDEVGTILTGIAMQSELLENFIDKESKPLASKIAERSREALGRMRDTVWAIDSRRDNTLDLKDRILDFAEDTLVPHDVEIKFFSNLKKKEVKLKPDIRQNIYLIAKEALSNIAKHSTTKNVDISLDITKSQLQLMVKDYGLEKKIKKSGQGLSNMEQRILKLGGEFSFIYQDGYDLRVSVPLK